MFINRRLFWSRVFAMALLAYTLATKVALMSTTLLEHDFVHEILSLLLVIAGVGLYLGGRKNAALVKTGQAAVPRGGRFIFFAACTDYHTEA